MPEVSQSHKNPHEIENVTGLEIQRGKSKWWYGRVDMNGRRLNKNVGVEIQGTIPPKLSDLGDALFERSRAKAQAALEKLGADMKRRGAAEELVQTLHEIRTVFQR